MHELSLRPALDFPLPFLAEAFARGFQGYPVAMSADPRAFEARVRSEHVHLGDSLVALRDARAVGLALVSRRGRHSRVAALGVAPECRREGLGWLLTERLLEDARARGDTRVVLECIETNAAALALYRGAGFRVRRRLVGWEGAPHAVPEPLEEVPLGVACAALVRHAEDGLPWQLAPETVAGLAGARAFRLEEAVAVVSDEDPRWRVVRALVVSREARRRGFGRRLVAALAAGRPEVRLKVPAVVPETLGAGFFAALGFERSGVAQVELERDPGRTGA